MAKLSGQTFVVTGTLKSYSEAQAKEKIRALGGRVSVHVQPARTDYVVVGANPDFELDTLKYLGVKTLGEAAFKRLLGVTEKKPTKKKAAKKVTRKKISRKLGRNTAAQR